VEREKGKLFLAVLVASGVTAGLMAPAVLESNSSDAEASSLASASTSSTTAARCMAGPGNLYLRGFTGPSGAASFFYQGAEGESVPATIAMRPGDCVTGGTNARGTYATEDGTATVGGDYTETAGTTPMMCDDLHPDEPSYCDPAKPRSHTVQIPLLHDSVGEAAVESFEFKLTGGTLGLGEPARAPVHVTDVNGVQRISFEPTLDGAGRMTYMRGELSTTGGIRIPVFRAGPAATVATVTYDVVGSGEHPADPEADIEDPGGTLSFSAGQRLAWLPIDIVNDKWKEEDETFDVILTGDSAVAPTSATVMILDDDSGGLDPSLRPKGKLHHPKQDLKYPQNYPFLNEIHIFTKAVDPQLPVLTAHLALRKRLKNGDCAWWNGDGFTKAGCSKRQWFGKGIKNPGDNYFLYKLREKLALSVGKKSKVRDYKMFARWFDEGGRESLLEKGRNKNRFEVIKPCKGNPYNRSKCKPKRP